MCNTLLWGKGGVTRLEVMSRARGDVPPPELVSGRVPPSWISGRGLREERRRGSRR